MRAAVSIPFTDTFIHREDAHADQGKSALQFRSTDHAVQPQYQVDARGRRAHHADRVSAE